ncbi:hypothetical protein [Leptolyngbya sp. FACHB-261]|nr:hypothetical protein [Leptolyngbya sp. FACHB-261]
MPLSSASLTQRKQMWSRDAQLEVNILLLTFLFHRFSLASAWKLRNEF